MFASRLAQRVALHQSMLVRYKSTTCKKPDGANPYTGDPFETRITLKRKVSDISVPNFEEQECIKWTDWMMLRDVKRRHIQADYWQYRVNLKCLAKNKILPNLVRDMAWEERMSLPQATSKNYITNRCAITSRSRGKFPRYRLSRIIFRECADHGLLSGFMRAKWG